MAAPFVLIAVAARAPAQTASIGANFTTMTVRGVQQLGEGFSVPPDTTGVVGPNHFVQYNNGGMAIFNKDGSVATPLMSETSFWQNKVGFTNAQAQTANGDPRLVFDPLSGRYFALVFTSGSSNNQLFLARSDTADPTGSWKGVIIAPSTGLFADFPTLGVDRNGISISVNNFNSGGGFSRVDLYSIPKTSLLTATPTLANMTTFTNTATGFTTQPINNFNLNQNSSSTGLLLSGGSSGGTLRITNLNGSGGAGATLSGTVTRTMVNGASPPNVFGPNAAKTALSNTEIDTGDARFGSTVYRVGDLVYMVRHVSVNGGDQSGIRVMVYNATTQTILNEQTIGGTSDPNFNSFYPSIAANANGDFVIGYTRTGLVPGDPAASRWLSSYATVGHLSTGGGLTFSSPIELYAGERDYVSFQGTSGPNRWGDYSATNLDPADPGIFWTTQEYASSTTTTSSTTNWATRATELMPTVTGEKRWSSIDANTPRGITGNFATAANWYGGAAPSSTDHVIFSRNGDGTAASGYTVTMPTGNTSVDRASVRQGFVTLAINPGDSLTLTSTDPTKPSLSVAEYLGTANLTVTGGGTLTTVTTTVGAGINSDASTNGVSGAVNASNCSLTITGAGTTWNNTVNVFVGGSSSAAGGTGSLTVSNGAVANVSGTTVLYNQNVGNPVNRLTVTGATYNTAQLANIGTANFLPIVDLTNSSSNLVVNGAGTSNFSGQIIGAGNLTKSGAGTMTLFSANTYTGTTTINGGTLQLLGAGSIRSSSQIISNATFNVSAVSNFTIGAVATQELSGSGGVTGSVTVASGSTIRGGQNNGSVVDNLTVQGNVTVNAGGKFGADLANLASGSGSYTRDRLIVDGAGRTLHFDAPFTIQLINDAALTFAGTYTITLATATNGATIDSANLSSFTISSANFSAFENTSLVVNGNDLQLTFTPVPEPATVFAIGAGVLGIGTYLRRKKKK